MAWPPAGHGSPIPGADDLDLTFARWSLQFPARDMQEISPLPDAGSELAVAPAGTLVPARPTARWPIALVVSSLLHGAAAAFFLFSPSSAFNSRNAEQSEGGDQTGDKVAGSALVKDPAAINVTLEPKPQPTKPEPAKAVRPAPPTKPLQPEQEVVKQAPEPVQEVARPLPEPLPEAAKQPAVTPDILVAATPRPDDQSVDAKAETSPQPSVQAESAETPITVPDQPPIPSARPTPEATPATTRAASERSGIADGLDKLAQAASKGKRPKEAGSDAEDSYRGDVFRKLGGVNRTLPPSLQLKARNNAVVTFVIGRKGGIDELRVLQSSGSAAFDEAALGIVRKAAPFPPIPAQATSPTLEFEVGIGPF